MGLFTLGRVLPSKEAKQHQVLVKRKAVAQFLRVWESGRNVRDAPFKWGDEIEYLVVRSKDMTPSRRSPEILEALKRVPHSAGIYQPEFCRFMVESCPRQPYDGSTTPLQVCEDMAARRRQIAGQLLASERLLTWTAVGSRSTCVEADVFPNGRYEWYERNSKQFRGEAAAIDVPVFQDSLTTMATKRVHGMSLGTGMCCLQASVQLPDLDSALLAYDSLAKVAPFLLALSAATPVFGGVLTATDTRWPLISQACDDRSAAQRSSQTTHSRYGAVRCYLHADSAEDNDCSVPVDDWALAALRAQGVAQGLATHVAHVVDAEMHLVFEGQLRADDATTTHHWDSFNSTNWHSVRLKPPASSQMLWIVEFRVLDVQPTDEDNSAFASFVATLGRAAAKRRPTWKLPISQMEHNMQQASKRDAAATATFFWNGKEVSLKTAMAEVFELVDDFVDDSFGTESEKVKAEWALLRRRAEGTAPTMAQKLREAVQSSPLYAADSLVSEQLWAAAVRKIEAVPQMAASSHVLADCLEVWSVQWPVSFAVIAEMLPLTVSRLFAARHSHEAIEGVTVAVTVANWLISFPWGTTSGLGTLVPEVVARSGEQLSRTQRQLIALHFQRALLVAVSLLSLTSVLQMASGSLLRTLGFDSLLCDNVSSLCLTLLPYSWAITLASLLQRLTQALNLNKQMLLISLLCAVLSLASNWLLTARWGAIGACVSISLTLTANFVLSLLLLVCSGHVYLFEPLPLAKLKEGLFAYAMLSLPSALQLSLQRWTVEMCVLASGKLKQPPHALATTGALLCVYDVFRSTSVGFGVALNVVVSKHLGAGDAVSARRLAAVGFALTLATLLAMDALCFGLRGFVAPLLMPSSPKLVAKFLYVPVLAAAAHFGVRSISGVFRALAIPKMSATCVLLAHWFLAVPLAMLLLFHWNALASKQWSIAAAWLALTAGDALAFALCALWYAATVDWSRAARQSIERVRAETQLLSLKKKKNYGAIQN